MEEGILTEAIREFLHIVAGVRFPVKPLTQTYFSPCTSGPMGCHGNLNLGLFGSLL